MHKKNKPYCFAQSWIKMQAVVFFCLCFLTCSIVQGKCFFTLVQSHCTFSADNEYLRLGYLTSIPSTVCTVCGYLCKSWDYSIIYHQTTAFGIRLGREPWGYLAGVSPWLQMHSALWIRTQSSNIGIELRGNGLQGFCVTLQRVQRGKIVWQGRKRSEMGTGGMRMH